MMKMNAWYRVALVMICVMLCCTSLASCGKSSTPLPPKQSEVATETTPETFTQSSVQEEIEEEETSENEICTNTLYQSPYLVFQAGLSSQPSDFYLTAFDTSTGSITRINKGFHRQYFIRDAHLYFDQYQSYYKCAMGTFQIEEIDEKEFLNKLFDDAELLDYINDLNALPEAFKKLDYFNINQVLKGHFTSQNQEDTLFLAGGEERSTIGIIRKENDQYLPSIWEEINFLENKGYPFWQSMVIDIDHDGLDELVVVGHDYDYHYNPTMAYVWDYHVPGSEIELFLVGSLTKVSDPELITKNQEVYLRYTFANVIYQRRIDYQKERLDPYIFVESNEPLQPVIFSHKSAAYFPSFSFLETFEQSEAIVLHATDSSEAFPCVTLPPRISIQPDSSSAQERQFVSKQNKYLATFLSMINEGKDPFKQTPKNPCEGMQYLTELDSVCQHSSLRFVDYVQYKVNRVESIFTVTANNNEYVVIIAKGAWDTYVFLFTPSFELLDIYWEQGSCSEGSTHTIVSLEKPSYFWISTYAYRGPYLLQYFNVENEKLVDYEWYCTPGMVRKNGKVYFEYSDGFMYRETKGCDSGMYASKYVDPFTHKSCNKEFQPEMLQQYDAAYLYCFGLKHREIIYDGIKVLHFYDPVPPLLESPFPDGRKKYQRLYWFFHVFEEYEMEITIPPGES
jgi:hypothetical protein